MIDMNKHAQHIMRGVFIGLGIVGAMATVALLGISLSLIAPAPITHPSGNFVVTPDVVMAGQSFTLSGSTCVSAFWSGQNPTPTHQARALVNLDTGAQQLLPSTDNVLQDGCATVTAAPITVPSDTPPGRYVLTTVITINGRFRTTSTPFQSQPFTVVAPPN